MPKAAWKSLRNFPVILSKGKKIPLDFQYCNKISTEYT